MSLDARLTLADLDSADLAVDAYHHVDELSELFHTTVEFLSANAEIELAEVLGRDASLRIDDATPSATTPTTISGIVAEAEQLTSVSDGLSRYRVRIVPLAWLATKRRNTRIFQKLSIPDIIDQVYAFLGEAPARKLSADYEAREYTVQYQETDDTFVKRLAAEVGIGFFFDHANKSRMTLFDDSKADLAAKITAPFRAHRFGHRVAKESHEHHVSQAHAALKLSPGKLSLRDFDHDKPALDLGTDHPEKKPRSLEDGLEIYEHDIGTYKATTGSAIESGKAIAARTLESLRRHSDTHELIASFAAPAGTELTLKEHPRDALNQAFLVLRSSHAVRFGEAASNRILIAPKDKPYRPERIPKPRIHGAQTAIVVGEDGAEIDVDDQARVCVQFHWDRRPGSAAPTRRIRVSQGWAGAGYGFMMLPRVHDEVIVSYLDGDPDEPILIGRVHNGTAPPPLKLPEEKTRSIWQSKSTPNADGHNAIMMEDKAGAELLDFRAQLDMNTHVERHATFSTGKSASENIGTTHTQTIGGNQTVGVGGAQGVNVSGNRSVSAGGSISEKSSGHTIQAPKISLQGANVGLHGSSKVTADAATIGLKAGSDLHAVAPVVGISASGQATVSAPTVVVEGQGTLALTAGGAAVVNGTTISVSASGIVNISAGATVVVNAPSATVTGTTVSVSGDSVTVHGSGTVGVTGGTVCLN